MWRNHLVLAMRQIAVRRGDSAITIGGLALALAGCLLMLGYVRYERNYDRWLPDHERVFQIQTTLRPPGQPVARLQGSSWPIYDRIRADFPQIEAVTAIMIGKTVVQADGRPHFIDLTIAEPTLFQVLAVPFLHGDPANALPFPDAVVLDESEAVRWFGTSDVLGRTLILGAGEGRRNYRITGVIRDLPRDTNLKMHMVLRRDVKPEEKNNIMLGWARFDAQHFVKLRRASDAAAINAALPAWEERVIPAKNVGAVAASLASDVDFHLQPITEVHLGAAQEKAMMPGGDARSLTTFAIVALLTLAMAVINFVNLGTARTIGRSREVALRRVLGATRGQLAVQFTVEAMLVAAVATLLALALVELASPLIGALLGADLPPTYLGDRGMLLPAIGLFVLVSAAGGIWPALMGGRAEPARALAANRGSAETPGSGRARAVLVVIQFAIAIGLIASTAVIYAQTRYAERIDPGFRRDGLIQIANAWRFTQGQEFEAARPMLLAVPGVTAAGRTSLALDTADKPMRLMRKAGNADHVSMGFYGVDTDLLRSLDVALVAGRGFGDRFARDRLDGLSPEQLGVRGINVVVNRSAAARLGYSRPAAALGQTFSVAFADWGSPDQVMVPSTIVGVVADTRLRGPREAPEPLVYAYEPLQTSTVLVRYTAARPADVMKGLEAVWRRFEPEIPFEARFAEDIAFAANAADRGRAMLFAGFSALAIVIACLGLYGLAAFATERRVREIGIRKVLGARVRDIVRLLAWQFARPVVVAGLVAWPIAWVAMCDWLNGFDARIPLTPVPFVAAGLLALVIALLTVAGHAIRAAHTNPVHALRYE